jgi:hypothetical protein
MYVPEGFNGLIVSEVVLAKEAEPGEHLSDVVWDFHKTVPAVAGPLAYKPSGMLVYFDSWSDVNKMARYHQGAKTIITSRTVGRTSPFTMPRPITPSAKQLEDNQDSSVTQTFGQIEAVKGVFGATATVIGVYSFHRWFSNRW